MPTRLAWLHALERRYNGPIPASERDAVLYATPKAVRTAESRRRFHRRQAEQSLEDSARWRAIAAEGGYDHIPQPAHLQQRIVMITAMLQATSQWVAQITSAGKHNPQYSPGGSAGA